MTLIGIDCGSTMVKAALFDRRGTELAVAGRKIEHLYPHPGWTENNMNAVWRSVCECLAEITRQAAVRTDGVRCITCTGHGNGLYLVDENGEPVRNGIISSDSRARKYIEEWGVSRDGLPSAAGKILPKTMQSLWAAQPNALLRWLLDKEPETMKKVKHLFMLKDYIRFKLTGETYMELSDMSATSLMNVGTGEYDDEVLATWGLLDWKRIMPPLKRSADICGKAVSRDGLPSVLAGVPVAGGMFDIDACGLAVGMTDETKFCMVAGTWGNNQFISKTPVVDRDMFMTSCYSIDGYYLMLEGSATSASNLEWFVREFISEPQPSNCASVYELCNQLVAETKPDSTGIVFLPYLYGSPVDLDAKACLFGLDGRHSRGQVLRAVYEGAVFGHRWHFERLRRFCEKPETIRLTGGAAASGVWAQMFADVFQIPVEIPAGTELGCLGAAICGAVAVGIYPDYNNACGAMVKIARRYEPNPVLAEVYEQKYRRYRKLLDVLKPAWKELT
ncbi:MAG: carbohydrate kinase [Planctomycetaceae bacterium]|jgi:L-xylulokinase|nr:carbohydrate kinase [Planctomycetaceae bacterium]